MPKDSVYEEYFERNKVVFNDIFQEEQKPPQQQEETEQKPLGQYVTPLHEQKDADWKQMEADAEALLGHQRHSAFGRLKEDSPGEPGGSGQFLQRGCYVEAECF